MGHGGFHTGKGKVKAKVKQKTKPNIYNKNELRSLAPSRIPPRQLGCGLEYGCAGVRGHLRCDGTHEETRFHLPRETVESI